MKLPADVANGLLTTLLSDLPEGADGTEATVSMVVATPKPRLVRVKISPQADASFTLAGRTVPARRYVLAIELGGVAGVVAPLVGKQPPDTEVWMTRGPVPGFLKSQGPLFQDGPIWRIQLASPVWPGEAKREP
jgi:hypothetical protein